MAKAFVSYSRSTASALDSLVSDLEGLGHDVWADRELTGGQAWWTQILEQIRECELFIFLLSPDSLESVACKRELSYATALGKPVLPVLVVDGVPLGLLPETLSSVQYVDYRQPDRATVLSLSRAVRAVRPAAALAEPLPTPPEIPISYLGSLAARIEIEQLLTFEQQSAILVDLRRSLRDPKLRDDARQLLPKLRARRDLLSTVAEEIDELTISPTVTTNTSQRASETSNHTKEPATESTPSITPTNPNPVEPRNERPAVVGGAGDNTATSRKFPTLTLLLVVAPIVIGFVVLANMSGKREGPALSPSASSGTEIGNDPVKRNQPTLAASGNDSSTDPAKQNELADYNYGLGGPKNDAEAVRLWRLSAAQGNAYGQANLGWMYSQGRGGLPKSDVEAARWYRLAAEQGQASAQMNLGVYFENGRGDLAKSDVEAAKWYRLAADQGNASAQVNLGKFHEEGRGGLAKSEAEAVKLYRLAAEQGELPGK